MSKKIFDQKFNFTIDELCVYVAKMYNPGRQKFEFRPCIVKYLENKSEVMVFWFSSSEKNEDKRYSIKIKTINTEKYPSSYFINTWTCVTTIAELELDRYKVNKKLVYISDDIFLEILLSLRKALKINRLLVGSFKEVKKYESKIRGWIKELKDKNN